MSTPEEISEAAERLRVWIDECGGIRDCVSWSDIKAIARAYLAEHPADDATPINEAWIKQGGWEVFSQTALYFHRDIPWTMIGFKFFDDDPDEKRLMVGSSSGGWNVVSRQATRGDVRRLCAALGWPERKQGDEMSTPEEIREAAERLRRWELFFVGTGPEVDRVILSDAYLAEHPADDATPINEDHEWLESRGFCVEWDNDQGVDWVARIEVTSSVSIQVSEKEGSTSLIWRDSADHELYLGVDDNATRGDVRRLCGALGIELNASKGTK